MDLELDGRVAIVTGASRGLGRASVDALVAEGMKVVAAARSVDDLETLAKEHAGAVAAVPCDVSDKAQVAALVDAAIEHFGDLHVVVNNAGIAPAGNFLKDDDIIDVYERVLAVNVIAPAVLSRAAARHYVSREGGGKIINVTSLSGMRGKPTLAAYSSSKGALERQTEALAGEWAKHGIQVNAIAPGGFETEAQAAVFADPKILERRLRKIPAGRMGDPHEIGPLVAYLASPRSNFVTGATYVIDGGELSKL